MPRLNKSNPALFQSAYEIDKGYAESQTILTQVLLGLSTLGLLATLCFLLPAKALRTTRSSKINICFTFALLLASVTFLLQDLLIKEDGSGLIKVVGTTPISSIITHLHTHTKFPFTFPKSRSGELTPYIFQKSIGCAVYAMLQHYLWLVVFCWMVIEGFLMYLSLVQVFGSHISKYMLKFNLAAWCKLHSPGNI